jgi:hypothetical protein
MLLGVVCPARALEFDDSQDLWHALYSFSASRFDAVKGILIQRVVCPSRERPLPNSLSRKPTDILRLNVPV